MFVALERLIFIPDGDPDSAAETPLKIGGHAYSQASALAAVDANDKVHLATDLYRRIWVANSSNIGNLVGTFNATTTAAPVPAVALAGRGRIIIQNNSSSGSAFLGDLSVTATGPTRGFELAKGTTIGVEVGQANHIYAITASGTVSITAWEFA